MLVELAGWMMNLDTILYATPSTWLRVINQSEVHGLAWRQVPRMVFHSEPFFFRWKTFLKEVKLLKTTYPLTKRGKSSSIDNLVLEENETKVSRQWTDILIRTKMTKDRPKWKTFTFLFEEKLPRVQITFLTKTRQNVRINFLYIT